MREGKKGRREGEGERRASETAEEREVRLSIWRERDRVRRGEGGSQIGL